jgi:hypothetical protein
MTIAGMTTYVTASTYRQAWDPMTSAADPNTIIATYSDGSIAAIPKDPNNSAWQTYEAWVAAGNTADAAQAPSSS